MSVHQQPQTSTDVAAIEWEEPLRFLGNQRQSLYFFTASEDDYAILPRISPILQARTAHM